MSCSRGFVPITPADLCEPSEHRLPRSCCAPSTPKTTKGTPANSPISRRQRNVYEASLPGGTPGGQPGVQHRRHVSLPPRVVCCLRTGTCLKELHNSRSADMLAAVSIIRRAGSLQLRILLGRWLSLRVWLDRSVRSGTHSVSSQLQAAVLCTDDGTNRHNDRDG